MFQSFSLLLTGLVLASSLFALADEGKSLFMNDDGSNIILTNNRDGRIVHIFVGKSGDSAANLITVQVLGVDIRTRSIHFKDNKADENEKYQSEILKDTFKQFRGSIDNASYQKLKKIVEKYVEKEELNHNIMSALKFLDAQGYELNSLLGNGEEMGCHTGHIIREERDVAQQTLQHKKCMVTQNMLAAIKSTGGSDGENIIRASASKTRSNIHIYTSKKGTSETVLDSMRSDYIVPHFRTYNYPGLSYNGRLSEPMEHIYDIPRELRDDTNDHILSYYKPYYRWETLDVYSQNGYDSYQPEWEPADANWEWNGMTTRWNPSSYSEFVWY